MSLPLRGEIGSSEAARSADTLQQLAEQSRRHAGAGAPEMSTELASLLDPVFMAR